MDERPTSTVPVSLDARGCLNEDLPCSRCEYNLRGVPVRGDCPECGQAVADSLRGNLARTGDPRWIRRLADGSRLIFVGLLLLSLAAILAQVTTRPRQIPWLLGHGVIVLCLLPTLLGLWLVTTPERAGSGVRMEPALSPRRLARLLLPTMIVLWPLWFWHHQNPRWVAPVEVTVDVLLLAGVMVAFVYAGRIARRFPDVRLARHTRCCMWGLAAAFILGGLFRPPWLPMIADLQPTTPFATGHYTLAWLGFRISVEMFLGVIGLFTFYTLVLLAWYRDRLRAAAAAAQWRGG